MKFKKFQKNHKMDQTKLEISKPILSPTRSLDEGFESDPDRISTDSELTSTTQNAAFDLLHRTDRDGVQHTTITRHKVTDSIICIDAGVGSSAESDSNDVKNELKPRRVKNRAPPPPTVTQQRSQSVDRIQSDFSRTQNILSGRFVRVTVDPKQQYLNYFKNYKSYQHYQTNSRLLPPATGSTSNLYKQQSVNNSTHEQSQPIISGLLSLSNLSSSMMPMQQSYAPGYSQTIKGAKNYHFTSHHNQHTQSHFQASSWTSSMDPRKARK